MKGQRVLLLLLANLIALSFLFSPGTGDVRIWKKWSRNTQALGLVEGYRANDSDYPPLSSAILHGVARLARLFPSETSKPFSFAAFKLSLFAFLLATGLIFWMWTQNFAAAIFLQLSLILNSVALGYLDIYVAPPLLLALWALKANKISRFSFLYTIACLIKWQAIIIAPFLLLHLLRNPETPGLRKADLAPFLRHVVVPALLVLVLLLAVYGAAPLRSFGLALSNEEERCLSGNALNFNWVTTHVLHVVQPDTFGGLVKGRAKYIETEIPWIVIPPKLLFFALYATALATYLRRDRTFGNLVLYALAGYLAYFIFNTNVHENHLFLASILAAVLFVNVPAHARTFLTWSIVANINLLMFYGPNGKGFPFSRVVGVDFAVVFAIANVLLFIVFFVTTLRDRQQQCISAPP
jgi:Gpi18-like mannosyltransferase